MKRSTYLLAALTVVVFFISAGYLLAQDGAPVIPDFYNAIFTAAMLQAVGAVIGFTQVIKNVLNVKGWAAIAVAFVVSMAYAFIMYFSQGIWFCAVVGLAAFIPSAGLYKASTAAKALRSK